MRTYEYKSITEGHKGADTRHDDDPGTSAEGNQQAGSVLNYSVGHPYRDPESVQYHENTGRRYAGSTILPEKKEIRSTAFQNLRQRNWQS
jgi:hypothetical protein